MSIPEYWKSEDIFEKCQELYKNQQPFVLLEGPPFATGHPHYGHILTAFIKDTILRYKQQQGHSVPRYATWDTHGLPIEYEIDKRIGIRTTSQVLDYGIANYNRECSQIVMECENVWESVMTQMGRWLDFKHNHKTMDLQYMNCVWWIFKQLYSKNRIYEGVKIMPYSTACATPLSNFETGQNYQDRIDESIYFLIPISYKSYSCVNLIVWTTTPWTLPANRALCVNPDFEYNLIYSENQYYICISNLLQTVMKSDYKIIETLYGRDLLNIEYKNFFSTDSYKIIADVYVKDNEGTGIVHLAPTYGEDDYEICIKNGIIQRTTPLSDHLDANGNVNDLLPEWKGCHYLKLNSHIIQFLKSNHYLYKQKSYKHSYPYCWRSDTPLIYRAVKSIFVRVEDMRNRLVEINKEIHWVPESIGENRFCQWIANAKDWGVSRSRFWGTPIPIWRSEDGDIICVESSYELEKYMGFSEGTIKNLHREYIDDLVILQNGKEYHRIPDILDCWFESGCLPYAVAGTEHQGIVELLRQSDTGIQYETMPFIQTRDGQCHKILPMDLVSEGLDQTRGWFYTLLVLSTSLFDMRPFDSVLVNGLILAEDGKKMSKRLQNYPDVLKIIERYSSDALRLYLLSSNAVRSEPVKFQTSGVETVMRDILIPLRNVFQFYKQYSPMCPDIHDVDIHHPLNLWILWKYQSIRNQYSTSMNQYNLKTACQTLADFVHTLSNGYIKLARPFLKGREGREMWLESLSTLKTILEWLMWDYKSLLPQFMEERYLEWNPTEKSVHLWQRQDEYPILQSQEDMDTIYKMITTIYHLRSGINLSMRKPLANIHIVSHNPETYRQFETILYEEGNACHVEWLNWNSVNVVKRVQPIKNLFYKRYGKPITPILNSMMEKTDLDEEIEMYGRDMFSIDYQWIDYGENWKWECVDKDIWILIDTTWTDRLAELYYYRLFATRIQRARKFAGLVPSESIHVYYSGQTQWDLESSEAKTVITEITQCPYEVYNGQSVFYQRQFEELDNLEIYIQKYQ